MVKVAGIDPVDAKSWRDFIEFFVNLAKKIRPPA